MAEILIRIALIGVGLAGWFWTQHLLGQRLVAAGIRDRVHEWTAPLHAWLTVHPRATNATLIATSAVIDLIGLYLIAAAIFGPSFRSFIALFVLFLLRQVCQVVCALPTPPGSIWRYPGFPALLVTYGTDNDYFFSGHTAIAVLGAIELAYAGPPWLGVVMCLIAALEAATVLVLRAHYTMDVFAAALAAFFAYSLGATVAPAVDAWIASLLT
jgi:hypothetical protein